MKKIKQLIIGGVFIFVTGNIYADSKVIIFNTSSWMKGMVHPIEIEIDGEYIGKLKRKQYLETSLSAGEYRIALRHKEFVIDKYYEDIHSISIREGLAFFKVYTGFISTNIESVEGLPVFFDKKYEKVDSPSDKNTQ